MDLIAAYSGMFLGYFSFSIVAFIVEFIINKSNGGRWGYKITWLVLVLNVALLVFSVWFKENEGY
jgi:hypothetical protein